MGERVHDDYGGVRDGGGGGVSASMLQADLQKKLFVSQATFLRVEMCHQNSVIRDKNLTKKQRDSRHNLVPKHKNHAQKSNLVH